MVQEKDLTTLAELARIRIPENEQHTLLEDLRKILEYFEELKKVSTDAITPLTGGSFFENEVREDNEGINVLSREKSVEAFPEKEDGFLKVPPVFE